MSNSKEKRRDFNTMKIDDRTNLIIDGGNWLERINGLHYTLDIYDFCAEYVVVTFHLRSSQVVSVDMLSYKQLDPIIEEITIPWKAKKK